MEKGPDDTSPSNSGELFEALKTLRSLTRDASPEDRQRLEQTLAPLEESGRRELSAAQEEELENLELFDDLNDFHIELDLLLKEEHQDLSDASRGIAQSILDANKALNEMTANYERAIVGLLDKAVIRHMELDPSSSIKFTDSMGPDYLEIYRQYPNLASLGDNYGFFDHDGSRDGITRIIAALSALGHNQSRISDLLRLSQSLVSIYLNDFRKVLYVPWMLRQFSGESPFNAPADPPEFTVNQFTATVSPARELEVHIVASQNENRSIMVVPVELSALRRNYNRHSKSLLIADFFSYIMENHSVLAERARNSMPENLTNLPTGVLISDGMWNETRVYAPSHIMEIIGKLRKQRTELPQTTTGGGRIPMAVRIQDYVQPASFADIY